MKRRHAEGCVQARDELARRCRLSSRVSVTFHAVDRASLRVWKIYRSTRGRSEGICQWLRRMAGEAIVENVTRKKGLVRHGVVFRFVHKPDGTPVVVTVSSVRKARDGA